MDCNNITHKDMMKRSFNNYREMYFDWPEIQAEGKQNTFQKWRMYQSGKKLAGILNMF